VAIEVAAGSDLDATTFTVALWVALDQPSNVGCAANRSVGTLSDHSWRLCLSGAEMFARIVRPRTAHRSRWTPYRDTQLAGTLDDVRIYDRALSADEIGELAR
jgi:hypothetical protein